MLNMIRACAQRLLQPLRRVALEEVVPACAPSCSYATEAASQAETTYKPITTMDINEYKAALVLYNRERAKWQREVSALRRQWLQEFHEQRRQQQEQKALQRRKRQEEMDRKAAEHRSTAQSAVLLHEIRQAELEVQIVSASLRAGLLMAQQPMFMCCRMWWPSLSSVVSRSILMSSKCKLQFERPSTLAAPACKTQLLRWQGQRQGPAAGAEHNTAHITDAAHECS